MTPTAIRNMAKFLALMQHGQGLVDKSPAYIEEKLHTIGLYEGEWDPIVILDPEARAIFERWEMAWVYQLDARPQLDDEDGGRRGD